MTDDIFEDDRAAIDFNEVVGVIQENIRLLVAGPILAGALAYGASHLITPTFTARTQFLLPQQSGGMTNAVLQSLGSLGGLAGASGGIKNPGDQYVAFLRSASVETAMVKRFDLQQRYKSIFITDALKGLEGNTRIVSGKEGLIAIETDDVDPIFAAKLANGYVEELSKLLGRLALTESQKRRGFFERQLQQTQQKLTAAQIALQGSGINEGTLRAEPKGAADAYATLKAKVTDAQLRLQALQQYVTDQAPEYRTAMANYQALSTELSKVQSVNKSAESDEYITRYREFKYQEALFDLFAKQYEVAKIDEAKEGALIQVVDYATAPERRAKPKRASIALTSALSTGLGLLIFIFVRKNWGNWFSRNPRVHVPLGG